MDKPQITGTDAELLFNIAGTTDEIVVDDEKVVVDDEKITTETDDKVVVDDEKITTETDDKEEEEEDSSFFISESGIDEKEQEVKKTPTEKKKVQVPFVNDKQRAIYNAIKQNPDVDLVEVSMMFNKGYEKMSMEELIKTDIANDPINASLNLTQRQTDFLYREKVSNILARLDPDNDEDYEESKDLLLAREANRIKMSLDVKRDLMIASLGEEVEFDADVDATEQMTEEQSALERQNLVNEYAETFEPMLKSGVLRIKDRDGFISVPLVDKAKIAEAAADPVAFLKSLISNDNGQINFNKFIGVVNYGLNPTTYNAALIKHGISQGKGGLIKEIKNTKTPDSRANENGMQSRRGMESVADLEEALKSKFGNRF